MKLELVGEDPPAAEGGEPLALLPNAGRAGLACSASETLTNSGRLNAAAAPGEPSGEQNGTMAERRTGGVFSRLGGHWRSMVAGGMQ